ncbi:TPA_asm: hypothetical protein GZX72_14740 [Listeria monocytogenes]|nr:hypothetical protein [Listeria monocytogenes]
MTNPFIIALGLFVIITSLLYVFIRINKKAKDKNQTKYEYVPMNNHRMHKHESTPQKDDVYHVGGMTTEYFILKLIQCRVLDYKGYDYTVLRGKKTQVDYDAEMLFDSLWLIFEAFDDILSLDYVEDGFGVMRYKSVEVVYYKKRDDMKIEVADMTIRGTYSEMVAFKNNPIYNYRMLDASTVSSSYMSYI